jgi:hypothetical protein
MPWTAPKEPKGARGYGYQYQKLRKALLPKAHHAYDAANPCSKDRNSILIMTTGTAPNSEDLLTPPVTSEPQPRKHEPSKKQPTWRRQRPASQYTAGNTPAFLGGTTGSPARDQSPDPPDSDCRCHPLFAASQLDHSRETTSTHSKMFNV